MTIEEIENDPRVQCVEQLGVIHREVVVLLKAGWVFPYGNNRYLRGTEEQVVDFFQDIAELTGQELEDAKKDDEEVRGWVLE